MNFYFIIFRKVSQRTFANAFCYLNLFRDCVRVGEGSEEIHILVKYRFSNIRIPFYVVPVEFDKLLVFS
jgi:hypothetical protein